MSASLPLSLVVAVGRNGVIGREGALPWHLSSDLKRFRALTWGKPLIMGRRTFESIGKPLPGRISVVLSADPAFTVPEGVIKATDLPSALEAATAAAASLGADEAMVIGGYRVFADTLPLARTLELTEVDLSPAGDVRFPPFDRSLWREIRREGPLQGPRDDAPFTYVTLERA
ncbi:MULTISPECIES: dihydrofolate reductase [unclassified Xanthobacter]|uniref:dihydrofolate reductase n=1 Tax=unclassified Xanthobacter TaxID=2623496 RepID=UPI001F186283|nr:MULTISPECIES: dihydrofolate reductase [unclassified Xanthobacter]